MIDIVGYNVKQLIAAGLPAKNIEVSEIDTAQDNNFFSHYRDQVHAPVNEGRFVCVVGLKS